MEWNPRAVFERLFGDSGSTDRAAREARLRQHKSILDSVNDKLASLRKELGAQDQTKIDAVHRGRSRRRTAHPESGAADRSSSCRRWISRRARRRSSKIIWRLMLDLQLLALHSDLTRVISFMIGKEQSARPYPQIGVPEAHHPLSHHNNDPGLVAQMSKINRYHAELFSKYLAKLRATPDGDGSLLDHMTILTGPAFRTARGIRATTCRCCWWAAVRARSRAAGTSRIADKPTMANLLVTLMDKMDVPVERVGGSTGKLPLETVSL